MLNILLKKTIATIKRDGFIRAMSKAINRIYSIYRARTLRNKSIYNDWGKLKNKFEGKRVFLIGNGPSLNKTPLYLLKNEYTLCFNRFFIIDERINFKPTFYSTTDNVLLSGIVKEVKEFIPETKYSFFPDIHYRGENFYKQIGNFPNLYWLHQLHGEGFSTDLPKVYPGGSVIYEGIQILNYLGFQEIYLIGVDLSYKVHNSVKYLKENSINVESLKDDDPNHFDPRYFGKNYKYHQPEDFVVQNILRNLKYISDIQPEINAKIINAGIDSKLEYFPKMELTKILNNSTINSEDLFFELISKNSTYSSLTQFEDANPFLLDIDLEETNFEAENDFYTNIETAIKFISKTIFTHIPLGPFNNKYYFIKRK